MAADFTRAAFDNFLAERRERKFVSQSSAAGYRAASIAILQDVPPTADMRQVDLNTVDEAAASTLSPTTRSQYKRRMELAKYEFLKYAEDPVTYWKTAEPLSLLSEIATAEWPRQNPDRTIKPPAGSTQIVGVASIVSATDALSVPFPLRPNFVAQVNIPRDLKEDEAKRLCRFIMMFAQDFNPETD